MTDSVWGERIGKTPLKSEAGKTHWNNVDENTPIAKHRTQKK